MSSLHDIDFMEKALALAEQNLFDTTPNPRVGCIFVREGMVLAEGFTQPAGGNHAEIQAIQQAQQGGICLKGATAYITLEPCSHFGKTPPCTQALINSGIRRAVVAITDPNPLVSGKGFKALRASGIEVTLGVLEQQAYELNIGFFSRMQKKRPWIRVKIAASLDAKTALFNGESQWITCAASLKDAHYWRARSCAILTGSGTVKHDNPRLTVRAIPTTRQPLRVLVDSQLTTPLSARFFDTVNCLAVFAQAPIARQQQWQKRNIPLLSLSDAEHKVALVQLIDYLGQQQINEVLVEAGPGINSALIRSGCVDELLIYFAPCLLGEAQQMFTLKALEDLNQRLNLTFHQVKMIDRDVRILARFGQGTT